MKRRGKPQKPAKPSTETAPQVPRIGTSTQAASVSAPAMPGRALEKKPLVGVAAQDISSAPLPSVSAPATPSSHASSSSNSLPIARKKDESKFDQKKEKDNLKEVLQKCTANSYLPLLDYIDNFFVRYEKYRYLNVSTEEDYSTLFNQHSLLCMIFDDVTAEDKINPKEVEAGIKKVFPEIQKISDLQKMAIHLSKVHNMLLPVLKNKIPSPDKMKNENKLTFKEKKIDEFKEEFKDYEEALNGKEFVLFGNRKVPKGTYICGSTQANLSSRHTVLPYLLVLENSAEKELKSASQKLSPHFFCPEKRREDKDGWTYDKNQAFWAGMIKAKRSFLCTTPMSCVHTGGYVAHELSWLMDSHYKFIPSTIFPEMTWAIAPEISVESIKNYDEGTGYASWFEERNIILQANISKIRLECTRNQSGSEEFSIDPVTSKKINDIHRWEQNLEKIYRSYGKLNYEIKFLAHRSKELEREIGVLNNKISQAKNTSDNEKKEELKKLEDKNNSLLSQIEAKKAELSKFLIENLPRCTDGMCLFIDCLKPEESIITKIARTAEEKNALKALDSVSPASLSSSSAAATEQASASPGVLPDNSFAVTPVAASKDKTLSNSSVLVSSAASLPAESVAKTASVEVAAHNTPSSASSPAGAAPAKKMSWSTIAAKPAGNAANRSSPSSKSGQTLWPKGPGS